MNDLLELLQKVPTKQIHAQAAKYKFIEFCTFMKKDFEVNWHHAKLAEILDKFIRGEIKKLMIFQPPQTGKSEMVSRLLPAYALGIEPNTKLAVCSYSAHLAEGFNRACQGYIDSEEYRQVFPKTRLNEGTSFEGSGKAVRNTEIFEIVGHGGFFKSVGVTGPLTGTPLDIGFIDDPFKDRIEADSERIRQRVWDWYVEVFSTRMHNDSRQMLTMTRWHDDDLAGRLLKEDDEREQRGEPREWTVVTFQGLKEGPPTELDPRQAGEALWESKHSAERYRAQRARAPRSFLSLYQQAPSEPGGNILKTEHLNKITWAQFQIMAGKRKPVWDFIVDPAYDTKKINDPSAIMSFCEMDNCMFIRNVKSVRMELPDLCRFIIDFFKKNGGVRRSKVEIEPKASGKSIVQSIRRATRLLVKDYKFPKINGTRMDDKDKVVRANAITDELESGRIYVITDVGIAIAPYEKQLQDFPNASHDDEVDCTVLAALKIFYRKRKKGVSTVG